MKFNVSQIVRDYTHIVLGDDFLRKKFADFFTVFIFPFFLSFATYFFHEGIDKSFSLNLFTLLGIFTAIFMAILGVLVPLFHARRKKSADKAVDERYAYEHKIRQNIIYESGVILSYMLLFSVFSMAYLMIPIATGSNLFLFKWTSVAITIHLFVNVLILLKRMHALIGYEFNSEA